MIATMDHTKPAGSTVRELISFRVGLQAFCVDITAVREIRGWTPATPLPQAPDYVRGVVNLRGTVLPIIDLGARLGLGVTEPTARHAIIVTELNGLLVGLLVEGVSDILTVADSALQPTPDMGCEMARQFVRGLLTVDDRLISLLALDRLLPSNAVEAQAA
jgi:purine-binding chemotaxis protein CheW